ncbi:MAG: Uma2 family endonuclease [Pyrinomonadaceae bacterium]
MAAKIEPLLTVADLDACPEDGNRYELIEGELFVSRAPRLPHQLVLQRLQGAFFNYLESNPIGLVVPGAGAVFSEYDAVIPDLVFVRKERWDEIVANDRFVGAPDLVIEVLSPGTENRQRDLLVKRQLYAKYGVEEYWVVDVESRMVLIHRLAGQTLEEIASLKGDDEITSPILPGLGLSLDSIFSI